MFRRSRRIQGIAIGALLVVSVAACGQVAQLVPGGGGPAELVVRVTAPDGTPVPDAVVELVCQPDPRDPDQDEIRGSGGQRTDDVGEVVLASDDSGRPCQLRVRPVAGDLRPRILDVASLPSGRTTVDVVLEAR